MRSQIQWLLVTVFLSLLAFLTACPKDAGTPGGSAPTNAPASPSSMDAKAAEELFNKNCSICHGASREGREGMAPALTEVKTHWQSADELVKYLQDPQGYADKDTRLNENRKNFSLRMPDIPTMTDDERRGIAQWLLKQ